MNRPTTGVLRVLRSAVVTVVVVVLAALAHVVGGGHIPSGLVAGAVVVIVALTVHLMTRWRLSTATVLALLAGGQVLLHQVFMAQDSARTGSLDVEALNAMPMGQLAHAHSLTIDSSSMTVSSMSIPSMTASTMGAMTSMGSMHAVGSTGVGTVGGIDVGPWVVTPMLAAHIVATIFTAVVLASGERALWRLWAWLAPLVVALFAPAQVVAVRLPRASRAALEHRPVREVVLARALSRRGPPVGLLHA
ncbi:hypothetical protein FHR75_004022 [Kineococcus radiotolerans]|uniref:Uncharacterized protein n=1 Tax=Kineococcus radiotolerans TaxID=131568 RepID=A0A7W4XZB5_KINRA|nr:hypothetical protein [Kineococcus radiotolerans]MBB2903180.1 hypothetical protein [Kineococcus radiotolerans]